MTPAEIAKYRKLPPRLIAVVLAAEPTETLAMLAVRRMLADRDSALLVLSGNAGCGKTFAAAWAVANHPGHAYWLVAPTLARPPVEGTSDPVDRACEVDLLALDDLGIEHSPGGYALSRIQAILESRELDRLKTIISTNLTTPEFLARYGERLASRINGDPIGWHAVGGIDLRRREGV